jgi:segregation and condensation protein B
MTNWKKVEAVLFASGNYVDAESISKLTGVPVKKVVLAIEDLKKHYDSIDSSLQVFNEGSAWKLNVKSEYADIVQEVVAGIEMPRPIMETLALVAYKSPVIQSDIINTRGTVAYDHISYLEEKKFISREKYGRSYKLKITDKFHDYFDVDDSKIQSLFEEIVKPIAEVEVQTEFEDTKELFEERIIDRMKKQVPHESNEEREEFLNSFDQRLGGVKDRIDVAEEEISTLTPNQQEVDEAFESDEEEKPVIEDEKPLN